MKSVIKSNYVYALNISTCGQLSFLAPAPTTPALKKAAKKDKPVSSPAMQPVILSATC